MVGVDVGCGFSGEMHHPNHGMDVSLDMNLHLADERFLSRLKNPVIASAEHLPFRGGVFSRMNYRAIMEHLGNPVGAMRDCRRALTPNGQAVFEIPVIISHLRHYLIIIFTQFPFSVWDVSKCMLRMSSTFRIRGIPHIAIVKPRDFESVFGEVEVETEWMRHKWFYGFWGRITRRVLTHGRDLKDIQGTYIIRCRG